MGFNTCLVENTRQKHLNWISAIMERKGWKHTQLAREAGIDASTLSRFINETNPGSRLSTFSIDKIAALNILPPFETASAPAVRGLSENEATPYEAKPNDIVLKLIIDALKHGKNSIDAWQLHSRALEYAGYIPGDIMLIDLNEAPHDGDVVCAQVYNRNGTAETVLRIFEHPWLVSATGDSASRKPLLVDNDRVVIRGTLMTSVRPRRAA